MGLCISDLGAVLACNKSLYLVYFFYSWFVIIGEIIEAIVGSIAMAIFSILDAFK